MHLLYHDVLAPGANPDSSGFPGAAAAHYKLDLGSFEQHLRAIQCAVVPTVLTFDDCGSCVPFVAERLAMAGLRGHFFAPTSLVGTSGFCSVLDLMEVHELGHSIGSHSHTHPMPISALTDNALREEWRQSKERLEDWLGQSVVTASIPGGFLSRRVLEALEHTGYSTIFTSEPRLAPTRWQSLLLNGRYSVTRTTTIDTIYDVVGGSSGPWRSQRAAWTAKKALKYVGGRVWLAARERLFNFR